MSLICSSALRMVAVRAMGGPWTKDDNDRGLLQGCPLPVCLRSVNGGTLALFPVAGVDAVTLPSRLQLPPGHWSSLLDGLCARFPRIDRAQWQDRFARGRVQDAQGRALAPDMPWQVGLEIQYFREVADEPVIPFAEPSCIWMRTCWWPTSRTSCR